MLRLLSPLLADGPTQMAWDEALLEVAAEPTLRLYRWDPPCVSLGYFQDFATATAGLPPGMPVVRRITGGGAIWHEHEVTYALVGRLGSGGLPERTAELYPLLHHAVMTELAAPGLLAQHSSQGDRRYAAEPRCFASPAAADLVHAGGGKVLGSAARARGDRVLVHGSLKLASNPWDGDTVRGCGLDADSASAALVAGVARALGLTVAPGTATAAETAAMRHIHDARYGTAAWVHERRGPRA